MKHTNKFFLVLVLVFTSSLLWSQGPPPPPPPPGLPIDGGIVALILAATIYGVKKLK